MNPSRLIDVTGVYGTIFHYAMVIFFVSAAFLVFLSLWRTDRLDMDEEPKYQMMDEEE